MPREKKTLVKNLKSTKTSSAFVVLLGIFSGLSSFMFLAALNFVIGQLMQGTYTSVNSTYILVFILIIVAFIWSRKALTNRMIKLAQKIFWRIRSEILGVVLKADYEQIARYRHRIQSSLTFDVNVITQGSLNVIQFLTSLVVVISCLLYMAYESFSLFIVTLCIAVIGIVVYLLRSSKNNAQFIVARDLEDGFMKYFNAILNGSKEIQIDPVKGKLIYEEKILPLAGQAYTNNTKAFIGFLNNQILGQVLFYMLITSILVYFSLIMDIEVTTTVNFIFILLYLLGALETIMVLLPGLMQAKVSMKKIDNLKSELIRTIENDQNEMSCSTELNFSSLRMTNLCFEFPKTDNDDGFKIGPIDWELSKGQVSFIYGGNGSGKTTFIHSVLGLLSIHTGEKFVGDVQIETAQLYNYKQLFAVVFNDFYLFDEFYGNRNFDRSKAKELLEIFEMSGKVEILENGFSVTDLSTGQRKRLAIIAAILEAKPILVLDEWAADQDPYFRKKFYEEIIPYLKLEGFTILAITHDDKYYHCADKIFKMEFGKLSDETNKFHTNSVS